MSNAKENRGMLHSYRNALAPAAGLLLMLNAGALAGGSNLITNPGFEDANPAMPTLPLGWNAFNVTAADYVDINDPGAFVRTGDRSIRLLPATGDASRFRGFTTNLFLPDGSDLFDPDYVYLGGDVTVSGYYLVPAGQVIQDTVVGVKLEFRREPPNFSIWAAFEFSFPVAQTGGEWVPFSFVVTDEMIEAVGDFPPEPTSVSVLPFRFFGGTFGPGTSPTGTVFIDDLNLVQGDIPGGCSPADYAEPFGTLNFFDISAFLGFFNAQDPAADLASPTGTWNFFDVSAFLSLYNAGCP
jgi:hypothetical protein